MNVYSIHVKYCFKLFSPDHFVDDSDIALDDLHDLVGHVVGVVWDGDAMVPVSGHPDCKFNRLQKPCRVYAAEYKAALVQCFGTLRAGSDAYGRNGLAYGGIERAFLRKGAAVAYHAEGVHL